MHKIYKNKWKKAESLPFLCTQTWGLALAHLHSYLSEGRQVFGGDKMNNLAVYYCVMQQAQQLQILLFAS